MAAGAGGSTLPLCQASFAVRPLPASGTLSANVRTASFPVVHAPASLRAPEGLLLSFDVTVTDADGDPVDSLWMERGGLPDAATFTPAADRTRGTFSWNPSYREAGKYQPEFVAVNPFRGRAATAIEIAAAPDEFALFSALARLVFG